MMSNMNPNEIKKALECCIKSECNKCPYKGMFCSEVVAMEYALAYINQLEAEVERLKGIINTDFLLITPRSGKTEKLRQSVMLRAKEIKSEAIKEFAERLKEYQKPVCFDEVFTAVDVEDIDNLVKEMESENNAER